MIDFKIRCSAIGQIMSASNKLTQTNKSYLDNWIKEQVYSRKKEFRSKYTDKGLIVEDNAIDLVAEYLGYGFLMKNTNHYEDDYKTGTPDILPNDDLVIDVKSSWDWSTFPLLEDELPNKDYEYQIQGYMDLLGRSNGAVIYVLLDTPQHLIEREARRFCWANGYEDLDLDIYSEFENKMTYSDIPISKRVKTFYRKYSNDIIEDIHEKVRISREYINKKINYVTT